MGGLAKKLIASAGQDEKLDASDVFSTYLYTGNGGTQTINNGVDLAGKGGLVWFKRRDSATGHSLQDTVRGAGNFLVSDLTSGNSSSPTSLTSFNSNGFTLDSDGSARTNASGASMVSWTFRKAPKFFDVVTYTGDGVVGRQIPHGLGIAPGMIVTKRTDVASDWAVYHRSVGFDAFLLLNTTAAKSTSAGYWGNEITSTYFEVANGSNHNTAGGTYVAYLFAHDPSDDGIIQTGSFTTDASGKATVNLGFEPQFVTYKNSSSVETWRMMDSMRGMPNLISGTSATTLYPNTSAAESAYDRFWPTSTGFYLDNGAATTTYIYLAIRRPNKPPTSGTQVFQAYAAADTTTQTVGFPTDMFWDARRSGNALNTVVGTRLQGPSVALNTSATSAENGSAGNIGTAFQSNTTFRPGIGFDWWCSFRRAPGFFDVVCFTGTGTFTTPFSHNLTVSPELVIVKARTETGQMNWYVGHYGLNQYATSISTAAVNNTSLSTYAPVTATTFVPILDATGVSYVAYLFASLPGIQWINSYVGDGTTGRVINCGFTTGARFVMVKATSTTGSWWVFDSTRGIVSAADPALQLNSTAAEVTSADAIDPHSSGFIVNQEATCSLNASGVSYLVWAIA